MDIALVDSKKDIVQKLHKMLTTDLLEKFYPLTLDNKFGGFLNNLSYDWKFIDPQDKMIVTQARHTWTPSKAALFFTEDPRYLEAAWHGYKFLKDIIWDKEYGGFYTMRSPDGDISDYRGYFEEKRTYGIAFGIYALAAFYELTKEKEVLDFAIKAFDWIENHAYDRNDGGYFQFLTREGKPFGLEDIKNTKASDANEAYYKDQNCSIHLLEAYTELYKIWPDEKLRIKLHRLLLLIRDTITTEKGYMNLFFKHNWAPVSYRDSSDEERKKNYGLDHVSFGHDYETAFLLLEASYALKIKDDERTLSVAKKMLDHALENGWDNNLGGFYDGGYYFKDSDKCTIINDKKNWWSQAEGLNSLLLFSQIFPVEKKYYNNFLKQIEYVENYCIDHEYGGWFEGGLDKEPQLKYGPKGHIWKACYHEGRSLMNCIKILSDENYSLVKKNENFRTLKEETEEFLNHWRSIGKTL
ncbi:MAG: AGE family epimerase/isomerase [Ignavibacteriales bacterium]|nr:AGE family epimerase/isomerase [Ignavibacteriales bacterium]